MLTPEESALIQEYISIDGDGNIVGNDNTVQITKVRADTYVVQKDQRQVTVTVQDLRRVFKIEHSQIGVLGDNATIYGGINFYQNAPPKRVDAATLTAAREKLSAMPTDAIPPYATLPQGSRMPFARNPLFVGREQDLQALARALKGGQATAIGQIAAATGLGGIGKTQLASEFVHRYGQYFAGGVFWLSFADPAGIRAEIATCGGPGALDLPGFAALSFEDQVRRVLSAWQSPLPRLLVFDNCENEDLLAQWRPPTGGARVLVTSRCGTWNPALGVETLRLDVLPRPESVALLRKHRPDLSAADAEAIADELGDPPLALHLAGHFLATYRHTSFGAPAAYLERLRAEGLAHPSLVETGETVPTAHARHVGRTFALSYARLDPKEPVDALARDLLARAACFAPGEPIPRALLLATIEIPADDVAAERQAADALARLVALGLLEEEATGALLLHRLLAAFVRQMATDDAARVAAEVAVLAEANHLNETGIPAPLLAWQPHLRAVTDAALAREDKRAAALCNTLGYHLWMIGDYVGARPYYERALAISEKVLGPKHPDTTASLNNLGLLLKDMGDLAEARLYYERALAIDEKVLGPDHPATATDLNNLGILLQIMGDLAGTRPYLERALAIDEKALGPDHPATATNLNNLGMLLQDIGDLEGARPYYERALTIDEKVLGPDHPATATDLNNLGYLLQAMGNLEEARPYYERTLAIREAVLGPDHPATATSLNNLGSLLQAMGDLAGGRLYYERALVIREAVLGPEHPDTARSFSNLGLLLKTMGDLEGARPYLERALVIHEVVLGPDHPDTATSLNNLGYLLQAMGDLEGARPYLERALAIDEKVLGPDHPRTATSLNNLAILCCHEEKFEEAARLMRRALAICENALGPEHPHTQSSRRSLTAIEEKLQEERHADT